MERRGEDMEMSDESDHLQRPIRRDYIVKCAINTSTSNDEAV